jgi:hypothetical protein
MPAYRSSLLLAGLLGLSACNSEPRSVSYFDTHAPEREAILAECAKGSTRGAECDNADMSLGNAKEAARQEAESKARRSGNYMNYSRDER